jgi:hypothetical protein
MDRHFYNLLAYASESLRRGEDHNAICGHPRWQAAWNSGILGIKKWKKIYSKKMLYLHVMMVPVTHPFFAFAPENAPLSPEKQSNYTCCFTLLPM